MLLYRCYIFNIIDLNSTYLHFLKRVVAERLPGKFLAVEHSLHGEDTGQMWSPLSIHELNKFTAWLPLTYSTFEGSLDVSAPVRCQSAWVWEGSKQGHLNYNWLADRQKMY